jgi:hypothetical protein
MFDESQRKLLDALNGGATNDEMKEYQNALNVSQFLDKQDTYTTLMQEGEAGEKLRKQMM